MYYASEQISSALKRRVSWKAISELSDLEPSDVHWNNETVLQQTNVDVFQTLNKVHESILVVL